MITKLLNVVDALLSDEYCATLETDLTICLLMCLFHMAPQTLLIREMLFRRTIINQAGKCPQLHPLNLRLSIRVIDCFIGPILVTIMTYTLIKALPGECLITRDHNFAELLLAKWAVFIVHE